MISILQHSSLYIGKLLVQGTANHLGLSGISAYTATGRSESFVNSIENSSADTISIKQNKTEDIAIGITIRDRTRYGFVLFCILLDERKKKVENAKELFPLGIRIQLIHIFEK